MSAPKGPSKRTAALTRAKVAGRCPVADLAISETEAEAAARRIRDRLFSLWVERAPRTGAVAQAFPWSPWRRRFVASFWAPEVLLFGDLYFTGTRGMRFLAWPWTRAHADLLCSKQIEMTWKPSGATVEWVDPSKQRFWSPELPEVAVVAHQRAEQWFWESTNLHETGPFWREHQFAFFSSFLRSGWQHPFFEMFLLLLCLALPAGAQTLAGTISRVTDGDTLVVGHARVRLHGIDAPEGSQTCAAPSGQPYRCGDSSEGFLARMAPPGAAIECEVLDADRYGRLVARCVVEGRDLSAWMVRAGWAVAFRRYSTDYVALEDEARQAHRGMWAGSFVAPWNWRKGVR